MNTHTSIALGTLVEGDRIDIRTSSGSLYRFVVASLERAGELAVVVGSLIDPDARRRRASLISVRPTSLAVGERAYFVAEPVCDSSTGHDAILTSPIRSLALVRAEPAAA